MKLKNQLIQLQSLWDQSGDDLGRYNEHVFAIVNCIDFANVLYTVLYKMQPMKD